MQPQEASKLVLKNLPSRRVKYVIEQRFGLKGGRRKTLDAIGKEYKITRERVRQIEADALKFLRKKEHQQEIVPILASLEERLLGRGSVAQEKDLFSSIGKPSEFPHLRFLLSLGEPFHFFPETAEYHDRWALSKEKVETSEGLMRSMVQALEEKKDPVGHGELLALASSLLREGSGLEAGEEVVNSYLGTSKLLTQNPFGEYGLSSWPTIRPRGVKDKAYTVLAKSGKPLHFREVASAIDKVGWSKKRAHPQTVHNELIKDSRFTLVGRGLYALRDWGFKPGVVREVIVDVLGKAGRPLPKDELIKLVTEKRFVKPQTILLNLQNKSLFKKTEEGKYTVV